MGMKNFVRLGIFHLIKDLLFDQNEFKTQLAVIANSFEPYITEKEYAFLLANDFFGLDEEAEEESSEEEPF